MQLKVQKANSSQSINTNKVKQNKQKPNTKKNLKQSLESLLESLKAKQSTTNYFLIQNNMEKSKL